MRRSHNSSEIMKKSNNDGRNADIVSSPFGDIRTRFLKAKIKGVRLGRINMERIEDAMSTLHLGAPRYKSDDFRYIAELIHLEHMLYRERQPDFTGGAGWGLGIMYLKEKYPKEYLALLDELDPKGDHRERYEKGKIEERIKAKEWKKQDSKWQHSIKKWWLRNGGTV